MRHDKLSHDRTISVVLGAALMMLASLLANLDVEAERLPPCVSSGGLFAGVAALALMTGLCFSIRGITQNPVLRPPNPRLQRTRFALLRSPLSRKPLGHAKLHYVRRPDALTMFGVYCTRDRFGCRARLQVLRILAEASS